MITRKLNEFLRNRRCTLLGVGPMSVNCVDAAIELSNEHNIPIPLIASRRQVESLELGGGYVNNWTTEDFANYVINHDKSQNIILARDHGGPWQNQAECDGSFDLNRAMSSAKSSFKADIKAGFEILHIDPSVDIHNVLNVDQVLERVYELYEFCWSEARLLNKDIIFEVGTEEQSGSTNTQEELDYTLNSIFKFCKNNKIPKPTFVVIQCGTRVMEMRNVGSLDSPIRVTDEVPPEIQLPKMIEICNRYEILMKEHNTDYLSNEALHWHPRLGIHAANVAPEFGVCESKSLVELLVNYGLDEYLEKFLGLAYNSGKWKKWMLPNTSATYEEKALIAGHYVFGSAEFLELKSKVAKFLEGKGLNLDAFLKMRIKQSISRYLINFRLMRSA